MNLNLPKATSPINDGLSNAKKGTASINPSYALAEFTNIIFCKCRSIDMDTKGKSNTSRGVVIRKFLIANKDIQQMISMNNATTNSMQQEWCICAGIAIINHQCNNQLGWRIK
jgi:hypothetical protein